jgi:hypothetical protein
VGLRAVQCWHCGKFRARRDVMIRRDREVYEEILDQQCRLCNEKRGPHADICRCQFCEQRKHASQK